MLGIIQGISEFLPISSSGHIVLVSELFSDVSGTGDALNGAALETNIALHLGTFFSILVVYVRQILMLVRQPRLALAIVVASIPVAIIGFAMESYVELAISEPLFVGWGLLFTATILVVGQRLERGTEVLEDISVRSMWVVGLFQACAIMPGISRSGATIAGGLLAGLRRDQAATFSFLIALPAIAGASFKKALSFVQQGSIEQLPLAAMAIGAVTAFIVGYFALRWLLKLVAERKLHWFTWYCATVGIATIIWQLAAR